MMMTPYSRPITRAFYRRLGYRPEARIANFYQPGEDKIVFTKTLT